ncbi:MAG: hypothetical protein GYA62_06175 [Bacteroidales bacterium]|nr:hypothetical protein [Bacteroidales bacterium]
MKRTQIYISPDQYEFLENLAFLTSKKEHKRISISEIIRNAITMLKDHYSKNKIEDKDLLYLKKKASKSLEEIWNNEKDAEYDKL